MSDHKKPPVSEKSTGRNRAASAAVGAGSTATGRYVYDKKLGKVVKVSDDIPGLKKGGSSGPSGAGCPMNPGGHNCNGCCGH